MSKNNEIKVQVSPIVYDKKRIKEVNMSSVTLLISEFLFVQIDTNKIDVDSVQLYANEEIKFSEIKTVHSISSNGITVNEYLFAHMLYMKHSVDKTFIKRQKPIIFTIKEWFVSFWTLYFMPITRSKSLPDHNENLPAFCINYFQISCDVTRYKMIVLVQGW